MITINLFVFKQASYLATKEDLTPLLQSSAPLPDMARLHLSLELVVLLQTHLAPDQECLVEVVRKAIKQDLRDCGDEERLRHFRFQVRSSHVREELAK